MSIKLILVPISGHHGSGDSNSQDVQVLEAAFSLGKKFAARVRVFLIEPPRTDTDKQLASWLPQYGLDEVFKLLDAANEKRRELALSTYSEVSQRLKVPIVSDQSKQGFAVEFLERTGDIQQSLSIHGKLVDLVVTAIPGDDASTNKIMLAEVALRNTGRPVLFVPDQLCDPIGEHIAIAWNGSSESVRAIVMSWPLLKKAKKITSISVHENDKIIPDQQQLADYLYSHGLDSSMISLAEPTQCAGAAILTESERVGADLLVMGAYTHNRARRLIWGGATSTILNSANIPVVMVH